MQTLIPVIGTVAGVVLGQRLTRSGQREQWIRDQRLSELRELTEALAESFRVEMMLYAGAALSPEQQKMMIEAQSHVMRVIRSRIFIAALVHKQQIELKWGEALQAHQHSLDVGGLAETYTEIQFILVRAAEAKPRDWWQRWKTGWRN